MVKRNIAIAILICIILVAFIAGISIMIFGGKNKDKNKNEDIQNGIMPTIKISDVINEAVYMGAYTSETPIFADEAFSAKETLRSALAKSEGVPEAASIKINDYNIDDLSVFFDDGRTMRTLPQSGNTNVMIVAAISQYNKDIYYAYNVEISVGESKTPHETQAFMVTDSTLTMMTTKGTVTTPTTEWGWNNYSWDSTTTKKAATTTKSWGWSASTTKASSSSYKPSSSSSKPISSAAVTEDEPDDTVPSVTQAPAETDPPAPQETDPPAPQETDPPAPVEPDPPAEPVEPDPPAPADPEPEAPAEPAAE